MHTDIVIRASKNRIKKDGTTPVLIRYCHEGTLYIKTGIYIVPDHFDRELHEITREHGRSHNILNDRIARLKGFIDGYIEHFKNFNGALPSIQDVRTYAGLLDGQTDQLDLLEQYERYLGICQNVKSAHTYKSYQRTYRLLQEFLKSSDSNNSTLEEFNKTFLQKFVQFLKTQKSSKTNQPFSEHTVKLHIGNLRAFYKFQTGKKLNSRNYLSSPVQPGPDLHKHQEDGQDTRPHEFSTLWN